MRVVMFGYQTWGHRTLGALLAEHDVVAVVTHPPSDHAYERIWSDSVAELAVAHDVPVHLRERPDDEDLVGELKELEADVFVATNWRTWIPSHVFTLPRHGTLNVHDSLLPAYGGFAPLNWALINGETEVGVTTHMMDADLDRGDIVLQRSVAVAPSDTATDLFHRTLALFGPITLESLELIVSGRRDWKRQDPAHASFFHKRSIEDSRIDWGWPAADIANLVRAQSDPYPNRFTFYRGERIRVLAASVSHGRYGGTPGRVFIREAKGVVIVAGSTARRGSNRGLVLERVRTDDDREHDATEFFRTMGGYLTSHP